MSGHLQVCELGYVYYHHKMSIMAVGHRYINDHSPILALEQIHIAMHSYFPKNGILSQREHLY